MEPHLVRADPDFVYVWYVRFIPSDCIQNNEDPCIKPVNFIDYITGVMIDEVSPCCGISTWNGQALTANAVAIRTWTQNKNCGPSYPTFGKRVVSGKCVFRNDAQDQGFDPRQTASHYAVYKQIATNTFNILMTYQGGVIGAEYRSQNGDPTNPCQRPAYGCTTTYNQPYWKTVKDAAWREVSSAFQGRSQSQEISIGLSQITSHYWGANPERAWNWQQILVHYYSSLDDNSPVSPAWSHYRANFTDSNLITTWRASTLAFQYVNVQNTANWTWDINLAHKGTVCNYVDWGYQWFKLDGTPLVPNVDYDDYRTYIAGSTTTLAPGDNVDGDFLFVWSPHIPGTYILEITVVNENAPSIGCYGAWFNSNGWPGLRRTVTITGDYVYLPLILK
jgi:hypothetical protein